jgi:dynein heavy chain 2
MKINAPVEEGSGSSPVLSFIQLERFNAVKLVQNVHYSLAALSKVIRGTQLLTTDVQHLASALLNQEVGLNMQYIQAPMVTLRWNNFLFNSPDIGY